MNRCEVLTASLADRQSELESAQSRLSAAETELGEAQRVFGAETNGFDSWQSAKSKLEYAQVKVQRARQSVSMATENHEACASALSTAENEQLIERLQAACRVEDYHSDVQEDVSKLLTAIADSRAALARARTSADAIESRFEQLVLATREYQSAKGEPVTDLNAATKAAPVLLQMLEDAGPDSALPQGWWHKTANLVELAWLEPVSCCTPRSRLEDLAILSLDPKYEAELARLQAHDEQVATQAAESERLEREVADRETKRKAHAAHIASLEQQPDPMHPGRTQADDYMTKSGAVEIVKGVKVPIETWQSPRRQCEYNKLGQQSSTINPLRGRPVRSQVVLSHGLELRIDWFADHTHTVTDITEKPGLVSRVV